MIYVSPPTDCIPTAEWPHSSVCHIIADALQELTDFVIRLKVKPQWYSSYYDTPYYCLNPNDRKLAILNGATSVEREEFDRMCQKRKVEAVEDVKPGVPIAAAREIAQRFRHDGTIIIGLKFNAEPNEGIAITSYGRTKKLCNFMGNMGTVILNGLRSGEFLPRCTMCKEDPEGR